MHCIEAKEKKYAGMVGLFGTWNNFCLGIVSTHRKTIGCLETVQKTSWDFYAVELDELACILHAVASFLSEEDRLGERHEVTRICNFFTKEQSGTCRGQTLEISPNKTEALRLARFPL